MSENKTNIQSTYKSADTEEWFDKVFNRPIGYMWAKFFNHFGVHPNTVTIFSMILGATAGYMFHFDADTKTGFIYNVIAVLLLMWANFYDSADGQLARMSGKKTPLGRILDGASADIWYIPIYCALAYRLQDHNIPFTDIKWGIWGWLLAAYCGLGCHTPQCRVSDYYRNIHLFFVNGKSGSEFDNSAQQREKYNAMSWKKDFIYKFFQWFYKNYTYQQEKSTPHFQAFWKKTKEMYGTEIPQSLRDEFRAQSLPLMKYTNILTFNCRAFALYISALIDKPWLYLLFELIVLSLVYHYMHYQHEKMSQRLLIRLQTDAAN